MRETCLFLIALDLDQERRGILAQTNSVHLQSMGLLRLTEPAARGAPLKSTCHGKALKVRSIAWYIWLICNMQNLKKILLGIFGLDRLGHLKHCVDYSTNGK